MESIEEFENSVNKCVTEDGIASKLVVAVMTVCGTFGSPINLLEIIDWYRTSLTPPITPYTLTYVPNSKIVKNKGFYNCLGVTFYYLGHKIAAKVFPNGAIQIPGCRNIKAVHECPNILYNYIVEMADNCKKRNGANVIHDPDNFKLRDVRIVMINSNFTFNRRIIQEQLKDEINKHRFEGVINDDAIWRIASFQPEKYSGVNIRYLTNDCRQRIANDYVTKKIIPMKLNGQVSVFIFRSGKGTITGSKNTKDLLETYMAITNFVRKNHS